MQIIAIVVYVYTEVRISMHRCTYNNYSIMLIMTTYSLKQVQAIYANRTTKGIIAIQNNTMIA